MKVVMPCLLFMVLVRSLHAAAELELPPSYADATESTPSHIELDAVQKALQYQKALSIGRFSVVTAYELRNRGVSKERLLFLNEVFKWEPAEKIRALTETVEHQKTQLQFTCDASTAYRKQLEEELKEERAKSKRALEQQRDEARYQQQQAIAARDHARAERDAYGQFAHEEQRKYNLLVAGITTSAVCFVGYHALRYAVKTLGNLKIYALGE